MEAAGMGVWDWDLVTGRITVSGHHEQLVGFAPGEFNGTYEAFQARVHPEDRAALDRAIRQAMKEHAVCAHEFRLLRPDGETRWIAGRGTFSYDNTGRPLRMSVVVIDVTERKEMQKALLESERKYRELVEHANSIILRWTRDGRITFLNGFGLRFFGYSAEEIVGRHVMGTIVPAADSSGRDMRQLMDQILADPVAFEQNVNENMRRNGERVWIAWTNRIVWDSQGRVTEIQSVGTDITEVKRAQDAIKELNASLERRVAKRTAELAVAKDRAEAADRFKSAFLASMSHELRTPLNSIIGFTGILLQGLPGPLNSEQRKQLEMVRTSSRHLLSLINDVLDLSKIEAGQLTVMREPFSVPQAFEAVVKILAPLAREKGLSLDVRVDPAVGEIDGDRRRVEQILINLAGNAVKFTQKGSVRIDSRIDGRELVTSVTDTGVGIKPEDMGKLFEMFQQIPEGQPRAGGGTGLGLSICKKLVEMMGGQIKAQSQWGVGSVFTFTLPLRQGNAK